MPITTQASSWPSRGSLPPWETALMPVPHSTWSAASRRSQQRRRFLGAEAQHLGAVGYLCALQGVMSPAIDTLDFPPNGPSDIFTITPTTDVTSPAVGPFRTTSQVLASSTA